MARKLQPLAEGGTGATTAADARSALGVNSAAEEALRDGYIVDAAAAPATPPAGRRVLYRLTGDGLLRIKDSAGTASYLDEFVDVQASSAALQASSPAASNTGKWGIVTGTTTDSGIYRSNGSAWVLIVGQNFYTKAEVDNLDEFESQDIDGTITITPKPTHATKPIRIGSAVTSFPTAGDYPDDAAGFTNEGVSISYTDGSPTGYWLNDLLSATDEFNNGNFKTDASTPSDYTVTAGNELGGFESWKAADGVVTASNGWSTSGGMSYIQYYFAAGKIMTAYQLFTYPSGTTYSPLDWTLKGSMTGAFAGEETTLDTKTGEATYDPSTAKIEFANTTAFKYYRLTPTAARGSNAYVGTKEFRLFEGVRAATLNTIDTLNLVPTGTLNFAPATLTVRDEAGTAIAVDDGSAYKIAFRTVIGGTPVDFSTPETPAVFKARPTSEFTACTELKLRIQPVGDQKLGSATISTTSSSITITPAGEIIAEVNGIEVWKTTADGDATLVDTSVASLTATGLVQGATVKATDAFQVVERVGAPSAVAGSGKFYTASDNLPMFQDGDGTAHQLVTADQAANGVTKSRHYVATTDDSWVTIATIAIAADTAVRLKAQIVGIKTNGAAVAMYGKAALVTRVGTNAPVIIGTVNDSDTESSTTGNYTSATAYDAQIDISSNNAIVQVRGGAATTDVKWVAQIEQFSVNTATAG